MRINDTVHSPIADRNSEYYHGQLSPISSVVFDSSPDALSKGNANSDQETTSSGPASLTIPTAGSYDSSAQVIIVENGAMSNYRGFKRTPPPAVTEIFPSDLGVEVAASAYKDREPISPNFQRRGRFLVWPASSTGRGQALSMSMLANTS